MDNENLGYYLTGILTCLLIKMIVKIFIGNHHKCHTTEKMDTNGENKEMVFPELQINDISFTQKRLYTKFCGLFDEVVSSKAELALYDVFNASHTKIEHVIAVQRLPKDMFYVTVTGDIYSSDSLKIGDEQYFYIQLDNQRQIANVSCVKKSYVEDVPHSVYHQHNLNDTVLIYVSQILWEEVYLREYLTKDGVYIPGRNQPVLNHDQYKKIRDDDFIDDNETETISGKGG